MAASSSSSSSSSVVPRKEWTYDVYISFRGDDTRKNFVDHLHTALTMQGIHVFNDEKYLIGAEPISEQLVKAMKESRFVVVVISKNYADSSYCLDELSTIIEYHKQMGGQKILPVGESASITKIVQEILADIHVETSGKQIGKLFVYNKEIGRGSNGTIVLEGRHDARPESPIAVKRVLKSHHDVASKEISHLVASDHHSNIVRYYDVEYDHNFVYVALELCICSLHELILSQTNPTVQSQLTKLESESFKVRKPIGYPSPELLKVMRETVAGLARLHKLRIIHRDLKPQNVLIHKDKDNDSSISAKVSDMGISKRLPADKSSLTSATGYGSSGSRWDAKLGDIVSDDKSDKTKVSIRDYNTTKVRELVRFIRNIFTHYNQLPPEVKEVLRGVSAGFEGYFRSRFPKLLMEVYKVLKEYCREEERLKKYFKKSVD